MDEAELGKSMERMSSLLAAGINLEGRILAEGVKIRERSKVAYGQKLLDARLMLMAAIAHIINGRSAVPGETDEGISHRLTLVMTMVQGIPATETLISEGQYSKAAAVLKQDYEILARLKEVRDGTARQGKTPNAKNAPEGSQYLYGDLNKVAHPSNEPLLGQLLGRLVEGEIRGVSPFPIFIEHVARQLYEVHVFTLIHLAREATMLAMELYPGDDAFLRPALELFAGATGFAKEAGFIVEPIEKQKASR